MQLNKLIILIVAALLLMPIYLLFEMYLSVIASLIFILMLFLVLYERNIDLFSPLNYLTVMIFFNIYLRYVWVDSIYRSRPEVLEQFLLDKDYSFLFS